MQGDTGRIKVQHVGAGHYPLALASVVCKPCHGLRATQGCSTGCTVAVVCCRVEGCRNLRGRIFYEP